MQGRKSIGGFLAKKQCGNFILLYKNVTRDRGHLWDTLSFTLYNSNLEKFR